MEKSHTFHIIGLDYCIYSPKSSLVSSELESIYCAQRVGADGLWVILKTESHWLFGLCEMSLVSVQFLMHMMFKPHTGSPCYTCRQWEIEELETLILSCNEFRQWWISWLKNCLLNSLSGQGSTFYIILEIVEITEALWLVATLNSGSESSEYYRNQPLPLVKILKLWKLSWGHENFYLFFCPQSLSP